MPSNSKNITKEPEDILAEVDKVRKAPPTPRLRRASAEEKNAAAVSAVSHHPSFVIGGIIVIVIVAGIAGYLMLSQKPAEDNNIAKSNNNINVNSQKTNENNNENTVQPSNINTVAVNVSQKITNDTDGDGLINEDEAKAGTDPKNPDTDNDGLSDREEVKTWKTNPLKADTDGDGYNDGQEIKTLNDPKVPGGKLLDLNKAIQSLNVNK
ncbi:MAG TPA: hypothetical protein VI998_02485 [Patescibacteria group bacterium]|nr:hypothetical protein [Patescibacteria group bacterium]